MATLTGIEMELLILLSAVRVRMSLSFHKLVLQVLSKMASISQILQDANSDMGDSAIT
jgi:hypothetical protein